MNCLASSGFPKTIAEQAAEWAVMADYHEMTPGERAELDAWLAADRRHRGAFLRARAGLYVVEDAVTSAQPAPVAPDLSAPAPANDNRYSARRRIALGAGGALAASIAALLALSTPRPDETLPTAHRSVTLADGTVAKLGKDARIEVALTPGQRQITLVRGEATFNVAPDKARPFLVRSGDVFAQATGTVYSVDRVGETGGTVKVVEGSVLVWAGDERDHAVQLHAGGELTLKPAPRMQSTARLPSPPQAPPPKPAQFTFDDEPIKSAIARFNQVNSTKILIADAEIGETAIVGVFQANDPERFARAAAMLTGGHLEYHQRQIVIKLK